MECKPFPKTKRPVAVLISDIHFNIQTLELAQQALQQAVDKAENLQVPLIVAGDLHDSKANLRAECMNAMIRIFAEADLSKELWMYIVRGNHDSIHEKSTEHALQFLSPYASIISTYKELGSISVLGKNLHTIPYHHDPDELKCLLKTIEPGSALIMHQGVQGSKVGDYILDHSALTKEDLAPFRVISGHYHPHQDIRCGTTDIALSSNIGLFTYIGNPFTLNFGEASDPPKGFGILYDNGDFESVPTNLRKHHIIEVTADILGNLQYTPQATLPGDLVWVKLFGPQHIITRVERPILQRHLELPSGFKLDLIPIEQNTVASRALPNMNQYEILDDIIQRNESLSDESKEALKLLWRLLNIIKDK